MALQDQVIPIHLGGGLDTKTAPKSVVVGKFLVLENATWTAPGQIGKRNGYQALPTAIAGGGNLVSPQMVKVFNGELLCQDSGSLYAYSPTLSQWLNRGPYVSVDLSETVIEKSVSLSGHVDCAYLGNYAIFVWSTNPQGSLTNVLAPTTVQCLTYAMVVDTQTNGIVMAPTLLSTMTAAGDFSSPRAVALGSTALAVTYLNAGETAIVMRIFSATTQTLGAELTVGASPNAQSAYDIITTSTGCSLFFPTTITAVTNWTVANINTSGTVTGSVSTPDTGSMLSTPGAISLDSGTGNLWIYWVNSGTPYQIRAKVLTSSLSTVHAPFNVATSTPAVSQFLALPVGAQAQTLFYANLDATLSISQTMQVPITSFTGGASSVFSFGVVPFSRAITVSGANYAVFVSQDVSTFTGSPSPPQSNQATFFLVNLATGAVAARFASGLAKSLATKNLSYTPGIVSMGGSKILYAFGEAFQFEAGGALTNLVGATYAVFDFSSARAYRPVVSSDLCVLNGACLSAYDGQACAELGFHLAPEILSLTPSTTGVPPPNTGEVPNGTFGYIAVFQWTDAQGNLHQSAPSVAATVTTTGTYNKVTVTVTAPILSQKKNISVAIYRTQANGTTYYLVTEPANLTYPAAGSAFVTFVDPFTDAQLLSRPEIYTTGNVVENSTPPPSMILEARQNRLWAVDAENPSLLWYAKSFSPGTGLSLSALLQLQIDPKLGNIVGLSEMDEKMIVLKEGGNFFFASDGANDIGAGSNFSTPQILPGDGGCTSLKSIVLTPNGVFFKKQKGIYLLDRALQEHYVGADVEAFNAQAVTGATVLSALNQVRFLTSSGVALVYDYLLGQWSTFTGHQGYGADLYGGLYTYAKTDGKIYQEDTGGTYLDGVSSFQVRAQLSWLTFAGVQGFQRVRRIALLGDFLGAAGHGVQISAAYDYDYQSAFRAPVAYSFSGANGMFQYRERLIQQKCEALTLLIEEIVTGASGEYVSLASLALEAGVKRGLNKMQATQSLG